MIIRNVRQLRTGFAAMILLVLSVGCNENRYQPADWAARKAALNTLPTNKRPVQRSFTTLPFGTTLPNGTTLPGGTTLPAGTTLPMGRSGIGTTLPSTPSFGSDQSITTLPSGRVQGLPSGTTLPSK